MHFHCQGLISFLLFTSTTCILPKNVSDERKRSFFGGSEATTNGSNLFRNHSTADTKIDMKEETTYTASQEDLKRLQRETILKRIPNNAEATTVLVS